MKRLKIATMCGCGLGTSFMLKFTAEKAVAALGIEAEIVPGSVDRYGMEGADLYLIPCGLNANSVGPEDAVVQVRNVLDVEEVKRAVANTLKQMDGG